MSRLHLRSITWLSFFWVGFVFIGYSYTKFFLGMELIGGVVLYLLSFCFLAFGYVALSTIMEGRSFKPIVMHSSKASLDVLIVLISLVGVFLLFYDRYFIRGIDYFSLGVAGARSVINQAGRSGTLYSFLGNLLPYFLFIPLINNFFEWEGRGKIRWLILFLAVLSALLLSLIMGGRTVVLLVIAITISSLVGRKAIGLRAMPDGIGTMKVLLFLFGAVFFFSFVFYLRASAFLGGSSSGYVENVCYHLTSFIHASRAGVFSCNISIDDESYFSWVNYFSAVLLYAYHVLWLADYSIYAPSEGSVLLAGFSHLILERVGIIIEAHTYSGFFVPAPAALLHDVGLLGTSMVFFYTGALVAVAELLLKKGRLYFGRYGFVLLFAVSLLSLLISPSNLPGFILIIICLIILSAFLVIKKLLISLVRA